MFGFCSSDVFLHDTNYSTHQETQKRYQTIILATRKSLQHCTDNRVGLANPFSGLSFCPPISPSTGTLSNFLCLGNHNSFSFFLKLENGTALVKFKKRNPRQFESYREYNRHCFKRKPEKTNYPLEVYPSAIYEQKKP